MPYLSIKSTYRAVFVNWLPVLVQHFSKTRLVCCEFICYHNRSRNNHAMYDRHQGPFGPIRNHEQKALLLFSTHAPKNPLLYKQQTTTTLAVSCKCISPNWSKS